MQGDHAGVQADVTVRKSACSLVAYLDILVDEVLEAYTTGIAVHDAAEPTAAPFKCRVLLLLAIADYPGLAKIHCMCEVGSYSACAVCTLRGKWRVSLG